MIDHTGLSVTDMPAARAFYDAALRPLGAALLFEVPLEQTGGVRVCGYGTDRPTFWLSEGPRQVPAIHIAFAAVSRSAVDAFHRAGLGAGGADNGAPGLRPHYHPDYYGAFVRHPDGNNVEAVRHLAE